MKACAGAQDAARAGLLSWLWNSVSACKHSHPPFDIWLPSGGGNNRPILDSLETVWDRAASLRSSCSVGC